MVPRLDLDIAGLELSFASYSLFMAIGALTVILMSVYFIYQAGLSIKRSLLCLLFMAASVPVGARILNVLINPDYYAKYPDRVLEISTRGFSLMGGLILACFTGLLMSKLLRLPIWKLADATAPGLGIGLVFMRMGCFLNGCCFGIKTSLPWGVRYPFNSPAHKYYTATMEIGSPFSIGRLLFSPSVHPTQIYELIGALIAAAAAIYLIRRKAPYGMPALSAAVIFVATRLFNHFLRVHPETNIIPDWFYPMLYITISVVLILLIITRVYSKKVLQDLKDG